MRWPSRHARRGKRTEHEVRVVVGLQALTRAVAEVERLSPEAKSVGATAQLRRNHADGEPERQSRLGRAACSRVAMAHGRPQRERLPAGRAGQGCAGQAGRDDRLSGRRRLVPSRSCAACSAQQVDEVICGVEIIARRIIRVLLRTWVAPLDAEHAAIDRPFFGIYIARARGQPPGLAAQPDRTRRPLDVRRHGRARHRQCSLSCPLHPDDRTPGRLVVGPCSARCASSPAERPTREAKWVKIADGAIDSGGRL